MKHSDVLSTKENAVAMCEYAQALSEARRMIKSYSGHEMPESFDWKRFSGEFIAIEGHVGDRELFNWKSFSAHAASVNGVIDELFNWEAASWAVAKYCPADIEIDLYNWRDHSTALIDDAPHFVEHYVDEINWLNNVERYLLKEECNENMEMLPKIFVSIQQQLHVLSEQPPTVYGFQLKAYYETLLTTYLA